ncbi:MAG: Ferric enterobactin receptor precursor [Bacteroidetes bacterium ADurb.Bin037]|nr:MAG: Ferric enterobactin receptor precursor [Bacteroidetes bacterium ADurb.Bin037]HPW77725.1 TonB-dependent receptor [Bacteroidales bacterium]HQB55468.1 TonB-dependent receptor [Bacteroidales bacterium]
MRKRTIRSLTFLFLILQAGILQGQIIITGKVTDEHAGEPLPGVYVMVSGTTKGSVTDIDGIYEISLPKGSYTLEFRYISYHTETTPVVVTGESGQMVVDVRLRADEMILDEVYVTARKNNETESSLLSERRMSARALEHMGAVEMGKKGISSVADGVRKMTGISLAESGQLYVRGLGDRYSVTTLNGLPIASPNPDNKLIPLDLFPTNIVRNITVSKVYQAGSYADYSGAHIDISVREHTGEDFFTVQIGTGGHFRSLFTKFYESDKKNGLFFTRNLSPTIKNMSSNEFTAYVRNEDPFRTTFSIARKTLYPDLSGGLGLGKTWSKGIHKLGMLFTLSAKYAGRSEKESYVSTVNAQGVVLNAFDYDSYTRNLDMAALMHLNYDIGSFHHLSYTFFYARNAVDNYKFREGYDQEGIHLTGSNSVFHAYNLLNNQLVYSFLKGKWSFNVALSYGITGSYEPDRRQVMYRRDNDKLSLFKLNRQETMRYYGELTEREAVTDIHAVYKMGTLGSVQLGVFYKNKSRAYSSVRFYYNLYNINPQITDVFTTETWLNRESIADGTISITKDAQPKSRYYAKQDIGGAYLQTELVFSGNLTMDIGLRYEPSLQWVRYWTDASIEKQSQLKVHDLFPALNIKYEVREKRFLRLALSRTVTRPLFIEMAPFLYKESYGSAELRGNESLQNGYNLNADLRFEMFGKTDDLFSATLYYKRLNDPIERVQESSGGSCVHSFRNAEQGMAAGIEAEVRKTIVPGLRIGCNASYMYTNVILPEGGGVYTDSHRPLQGASPYLINADIAYGFAFRNKDQLTLTLLYNLQGPRIHAVGIYGMGNIMQQPLHTLDLVAVYNCKKKWNIKISVENMLDSDYLFTQEIKTTNETKTVESFRPGVSCKLGFSYTFIK